MSEELRIAWLVRVPFDYKGKYQGYFGPPPYKREELFYELHPGDRHELDKRTVLEVRPDGSIFLTKTKQFKDEKEEYAIHISGHSFASDQGHWKICTTKELAEIWMDDITWQKDGCGR